MKETSRVIWSDVSRQKLGRVTLAGYVDIRGRAWWDRMRILGSYALVYLHAGAGLYEDATGLQRLLRAGDLIVVYPDLAHRYGPRPNSTDCWSEFYVVFDGPIFDLWRSEGLLGQTVYHLEPTTYWLPRLVGVVENQTPREAMVAVQDFLAQITPQPPAASAAANWLGRAKALLGGFNRIDQINVVLVARAMDETYETFRKKFQKLGGISPGRYASERVMARACAMIQSQPESLSQIATACGFCDEFHFGRRFKQMVGVTPSQYRRQFQRR